MHIGINGIFRLFLLEKTYLSIQRKKNTVSLLHFSLIIQNMGYYSSRILNTKRGIWSYSYVLAGIIYCNLFHNFCYSNRGYWVGDTRVVHCPQERDGATFPLIDSACGHDCSVQGFRTNNTAAPVKTEITFIFYSSFHFLTALKKISHSWLISTCFIWAWQVE